MGRRNDCLPEFGTTTMICYIRATGVDTNFSTTMKVTGKSTKDSAHRMVEVPQPRRCLPMHDSMPQEEEMVVLEFILKEPWLPLQDMIRMTKEKTLKGFKEEVLKRVFAYLCERKLCVRHLETEDHGYSAPDIELVGEGVGSLQRGYRRSELVAPAQEHISNVCAVTQEGVSFTTSIESTVVSREVPGVPRVSDRFWFKCPFSESQAIIDPEAASSRLYFFRNDILCAEESDSGLKTQGMNVIQSLPPDPVLFNDLRVAGSSLSRAPAASPDRVPPACGDVREHLRESSLLNLFVFTARLDGHFGVEGYDNIIQKWTQIDCPLGDVLLPTKRRLVDCDSGLMCVNVSEFPDSERLVMINLLTLETRELPSLNFPRHPVLMHLQVNKNTNTYTVIVAGSATTGTEGLSRITEVYNSENSMWTVAGDIPGPEFALNEYQNGASSGGILYCNMHLYPWGGKGVMAYDMTTHVWLPQLSCSLWSMSAPHVNGIAPNFPNAQLVEWKGSIYLYSTEETGRNVRHCIYRLEDIATGEWERLVASPEPGGRGLLVYPEYTCVGVDDGKLCIFNTITRTGMVHDIHRGTQEVLPAPEHSFEQEETYHPLNPISFRFELDASMRV